MRVQVVGDVVKHLQATQPPVVDGGFDAGGELVGPPGAVQRPRHAQVAGQRNGPAQVLMPQQGLVKISVSLKQQGQRHVLRRATQRQGPPCAPRLQRTLDLGFPFKSAKAHTEEFAPVVLHPGLGSNVRAFQRPPQQPVGGQADGQRGPRRQQHRLVAWLARAQPCDPRIGMQRAGGDVQLAFQRTAPQSLDEVDVAEAQGGVVS